MRYIPLLAALLLISTADARTPDRGDRGGHHGGGHHGGGHQGGGQPSTPEVSTPTPSAPASNSPNGNGIGEAQSMGPSFSPTSGSYNNACATWWFDIPTWNALFKACN